MKSQAVVATRPGHVEFQSVTIPDPGPHDVVVGVQHSWISNGTEGSFVRGERIGGDTPRQTDDAMPFPHVPGYQKVGRVEWAGAEVTHVQPGDSVFATVSRVSDMFYDSGGHVSPAVTHKSQVWKLPEDVDPVAASGLILTQVGVNIGLRPECKREDRVVVIGDGMVGHWAAQTFQHRGARVLMLGKHDDRLNRFEVTPLDRIVNITRQSPLEAVKEWVKTGNSGADDRVQVVADTVGSIATVESLLPIMRRFSHFVSAGFYGSAGRIDIQKLRDNEMTLHAPSGWTSERVAVTLELLRTGALKTLPLITHRFPVAEATSAYDLILSRHEPVLGVVLDWE